MNKIISVSACMLALAGFSASAHADVLLGYQVAGGNLSAVDTLVDVSGSSTLTFGAGLVEVGNPAAAIRVDRSGALADWTSTTAEANTSGTTVDFTVTFGAGTDFNLNTLSFGLSRGTGDTIALRFGLFFNLNSAGFVNTGLPTQLLNGGSTATLERSFDISGVTALDGIGNGDVVAFRVIVFSADTTDTTSDFAFSNIANLGTVTTTNTRTIVLEGTNLNAVPEPGAFAMIAGAAVLGFVAFRRRTSAK